MYLSSFVVQSLCSFYINLIYGHLCRFLMGGGVYVLHWERVKKDKIHSLKMCQIFTCIWHCQNRNFLYYILHPTPTPYHHKQPHSRVKTPRTPVQRRPHVATDEVPHQHETAVSQKLVSTLYSGLSKKCILYH